jgi:hypothetical protein
MRIKIRILPSSKVRKTLISSVFCLFMTFLSSKNDVNVPSKRKKHKNFESSVMERAGARSGARSKA